MTQTARLLETLKHYLKIQGITYRILAQRLKLSESSVKRLFSDQSLSLKHLERFVLYWASICMNWLNSVGSNNRLLNRSMMYS